MTAVMITDGNNFHPADYHAEVTAEKIVVVGEDVPANVASAARTFRKKVEAILTDHHLATEVAEQAALAEHGAARYAHELESVVADDILPRIMAAAKGTVLEAHFLRTEVQEAILAELHHETRSQMNVHRLVHQAANTAA